METQKYKFPIGFIRFFYSFPPEIGSPFSEKLVFYWFIGFFDFAGISSNSQCCSNVGFTKGFQAFRVTLARFRGGGSYRNVQFSQGVLRFSAPTENSWISQCCSNVGFTNGFQAFWGTFCPISGGEAIEMLVFPMVFKVFCPEFL